MNVGELRKALEGLPDDLLVIMSKDPEGNGYSPLSSLCGTYTYLADSTWSGEVSCVEHCAEHQLEYGYKEPCDHSDCRFGQGVPCVILDPVN